MIKKKFFSSTTFFFVQLVNLDHLTLKDLVAVYHVYDNRMKKMSLNATKNIVYAHHVTRESIDVQFKTCIHLAIDKSLY